MPDLVHRRLRAPQDDGAALVDPPLDQLPNVVKRNEESSRRHSGDILGLSLDRLRLEARRELFEQAVQFTEAHRDIGFVNPPPSGPMIIAGHQPELFHPGVWFKDFLLSALAARTTGVGINLIVDSDTVRSTAIRVPVCGDNQAVIENVPFDASGAAIPFEERPVLDTWLFESFGQRVMAACEICRISGNGPYRLLIDDLWKAAVPYARTARGAGRLGLALAEARHWVEWKLGLQTLEVPLSRVAQTRSFRRVVLHLLSTLPQLWRTYNSCLQEYRSVNHIRSSTHPVPGLAEQDDWLEAPFFVWTKEDPRRRHLFVRRQTDSLLISDLQDWRLGLELGPDGSPDRAIDQLAAAESRGIKIRPRALITTMYARLLLSDLFIHGIGGAKYDELTDLIIRRFFGIEPPAYVTATATFRLPIDRPNVSIEDVRNAVRRIRETRYRPESFLRDERVKQDTDLSAKLSALAAEKREFLDRHDLRRCSQDVFDQ